MSSDPSMSDVVKVFVHGNPETDAVWAPLVDELVARDVDEIELFSPPGFGAPLPADFGASSDDYLAWLVDSLTELTSSGRTVDIVGHDWGAGHVYRLIDARPDLVRSWAADIGGLLHPEYRWHDAARAWQTPDVGEEVIEMMLSMPLDDRVATYVGLGIPAPTAESFARAMGDEMGRAILALYRSAPESELQALATRLESAELPPGLIVTATADAYVGADLAGPVARRLGADELVLHGQGHWWMIADPTTAAAGLAAFWSSL